MNKTTRLRSGALAAAAIAALLSAAPASAALNDAAVSCRASIAKSYSKLVSTANKTIASCHKSRDKGDTTLTGTDCNDLNAGADLKGKFASAVTKNTDTITAACGSLDSVLTALNHDGGPKQYYISCPVTCTGVANPINTMTEVGKCLGCEAAAIAGDAGETTLGLPVQGLDSTAQKCRATLAKGYGKYLSTAVKDHNSCQSSADKAGNNDITTCTTSDSKGKVASSLSSASSGLASACAGVNLATAGFCATDTLSNVQSCTGAAWGAAQQDAFTTTYELPSTTCPSVIRTTILGGCSTQGTDHGVCSSGFQTGTQLSVGWKGLGHGIDIVDNYTLAGDVTCPGTVKGTCGTCTVNGISTDNAQYTAFTRCEESPWLACTHPFANDSACGTCASGANMNDACTTDAQCPGSTCTAGACKYYLGPPLAISAGGTPTCTENIMSANITGTAAPDAGTSSITVFLRAKVFLGASQARPCPICQNDTTPQDGVKNGLCLGGPQDGQACDVQGFDLSFANPDAVDHPNDGSSLDCPPPSGGNVSGSGLAINLPLTTGTSSKTAVDACDGANAGLNCFCGACSNDPTVSCDNDTVCSSQGLGTCGAGNGVDRLPNNCSDGICTPVPGQTDRGVCSTGHSGAGDVDNFCSGLLFANGHGVISCNLNADCDTYASICPGNDCGTCTTQSFRSCFLNPINVSGTPDTERPILAGAFCLPPSSNGSVNAATGAPGPGVVQTDSVVQLRY